MDSSATSVNMLSPVRTPSPGNRGVPNKPRRRSTLSPKEDDGHNRKRRQDRKRSSGDSTDSSTSLGSSSSVASQVLKNVLHQQSKDPVRKDSIEEAEDILSEPEEEDDEQSLPSLVSYRISSVTSTGTVSRSSSFSSSCSSMLIYVKDALDQLELDSGDEEEEWEDEARHVRQSLPPPPAVESSHSAFKDNGDQDSTPKMINLIHRKQKNTAEAAVLAVFKNPSCKTVL
jgi:hypothetical protein